MTLRLMLTLIPTVIVAAMITLVLRVILIRTLTVPVIVTTIDSDSSSDNDSAIIDGDSDDIYGCVISQQTGSKAGLGLPSV